MYKQSDQTAGNYEPAEQRSERVEYFSPAAFAGILGVPLKGLYICPETNVPFTDSPNGRVPVIETLNGEMAVVVKETKTGELVKRRGAVAAISLETLLNSPDVRDKPCDGHNQCEMCDKN